MSKKNKNSFIPKAKNYLGIGFGGTVEAGGRLLRAGYIAIGVASTAIYLGIIAVIESGYQGDAIDRKKYFKSFISSTTIKSGALLIPSYRVEKVKTVNLHSKLNKIGIRATFNSTIENKLHVMQQNNAPISYKSPSFKV